MLTDLAIRRAKACEKPYKVADAGGLYLFIKPNGARFWYLKYRWGGREKKLAFGPYPDVSLADAREAVRVAKANIRDGRDPSLVRKQDRARASDQSSLLEVVGQAWIQHNSSRWTAKHRSDVESSLARCVYPKLGNLPLQDITAPMILDVLRSVERTAIETAHRLRQRLSGIYCYAMAAGIVDRDPAAELKTLLKPVKKSSLPALLKIEDLQNLIEDLEASPSYPVTLLALRFLAITAVRSNEVRGMLWTEVDGHVWTIPAERMKMRRSHIVCLSKQALEILEAVKPFSKQSPLVFPSCRWADRPLSDMALSMLIKRSKFAGMHVPHGFRASFSSIMNERRPADRAVIDLMLAHVQANAVEAAYNRSEHLATRAIIAQEWSDLLLQNAVPAHELLAKARR